MEGGSAKTGVRRSKKVRCFNYYNHIDDDDDHIDDDDDDNDDDDDDDDEGEVLQLR